MTDKLRFATTGTHTPLILRWSSSRSIVLQFRCSDLLKGPRKGASPTVTYVVCNRPGWVTTRGDQTHCTTGHPGSLFVSRTSGNLLENGNKNVLQFRCSDLLKGSRKGASPTVTYVVCNRPGRVTTRGGQTHCTTGHPGSLFVSRTSGNLLQKWK